MRDMWCAMARCAMARCAMARTVALDHSAARRTSSWRWIRRRSSCSVGHPLTPDLLVACLDSAQTRGRRGTSSPGDSRALSLRHRWTTTTRSQAPTSCTRRAGARGRQRASPDDDSDRFRIGRQNPPLLSRGRHSSSAPPVSDFDSSAVTARGASARRRSGSARSCRSAS
jgi:hypothetical protein